MSLAEGEGPALRARPRRRPRRRLGLAERRGALAVVGLALVGWLGFVFAGTLGRADDLDAQALAARAQVEALEARLELGRAEVDFVGSDAFVEQGARTLGWGEEGELAFELDADAPAPAPVPLLGALPEEGPAEGPLEALVRILRGA
jgi:hypothetical protein